MKTAFPPIADSNSRILMLGTMPGEQSLKLQQYYGHRGNHFWKLLFALYDKPFTYDYEKRKQLLAENGIALWDVLQYCEREGSADSNIKNEVANDFAAFYKAHPNIKTVYFTASKAQALYDRHVGRSSGLVFHTLPSPSGANAWKSFEQKLEEWKHMLQH